MAAHHRWGRRSREALATVEPALAELVCRARDVVPFDLTVTCGRRSREEQERAVREGHSRVHWPHGKHNVEREGEKARAVDVHPYPIDWQDQRRYVFLAGVMTALGDRMDTPVRWGGNWDGDATLITDQRLVDLPHYELL